MAISVAPTYFDFTTLTDPFRVLQGFDYPTSEPMEYGVTPPLEKHTGIVTNLHNLNSSGLNHHQQHHHHHHSHNNNSHHQQNQQQHPTGPHYSSGTSHHHHHHHHHSQNHDFEHFVDLVDSPPDSKEAWPSEYIKSAAMHGPTVLEIQPISAGTTANSTNAIASRKRRMDWEDSLDVTVNTSAVSEPKIPYSSGGGGSSASTSSKERERKKSGRLGWSEDIDFDLNSELTNNGYLNEALLYSSLTALKQEVPSPTHEIQKNPSLNNEKHHQPQRTAITTTTIVNNQNNGTAIENKSNNNNNNNNNNNSAGAGGGQQTHPSVNGGGIVEQQQNVGLQHLLQDNDFDESGNGSPQSQDGAVIQLRKEVIMNDDCRFQYVLAAATSIATKNNEDTLTYLNQGQSYEIKLKKLGDLSNYRNKILKTVIKICFYERRLQYMEKEQMQQWQASRPGERIVEVDVPLSYGLCHVIQPTNPLFFNTVEVLWDPMKEVGVYIKVNCISTEFTPKKHGGEKGVPFRIQVETYLETNNSMDTSGMAALKPIHAAACQIKVFKLKGADRKHKQDREKIQKRPPSEQEKYQPSYDCTILNDIPSDSLMSQNCYSPDHGKSNLSPMMVPTSPVHVPKYDPVMQFNNSNSNPIAINNVSSTNQNLCKIIDQNILSPPQIDADEFLPVIAKESTPSHLVQWMNYHRLSAYSSTFSHFCGSDLLRMTKDDLIQICGLADGIRMYNTLHSKAIIPRLTIFVSFDSICYHAIYLHSNTMKELMQKLLRVPGFYDHFSSSSPAAGNGSNSNNTNNNLNGTDNIYSTWGLQSKFAGSGSNLYDASKFNIYINGPTGIQVLVTDDVVANIKDESLFALDIQNGKILMKALYKNE